MLGESVDSPAGMVGWSDIAAVRRVIAVPFSTEFWNEPKSPAKARNRGESDSEGIGSPPRGMQAKCVSYSDWVFRLAFSDCSAIFRGGRNRLTLAKSWPTIRTFLCKSVSNSTSKACCFASLSAFFRPRSAFVRQLHIQTRFETSPRPTSLPGSTRP
jgi:hypothetical protein